MTRDEAVERMWAASRAIKFAVRQLGNVDDAADAIQDALLKCIEYASGHEIYNPEGLLYAELQHRIIRVIEKRERARALFCALDDVRGLPSSDPDILDELIRADLIQRSLSKLGERDREVLRRRHVEAQTPYEICAEMGLPRDDYEGLRGRAIHKIRLRTSARPAGRARHPEKKAA